VKLRKGAGWDASELVNLANKYDMHLHVFRTPEEDFDPNHFGPLHSCLC
jgi:hypothetical protein